ncbi:hypothetical protein, partial [Hahella sp. HN01]|uniref:hypothetical protein n=1 Tax=Hahella sp. HN01 TaxID=2847262 RepID=UPI001C1F02E7
MNDEDIDISNILDAIIEGRIKRDEAEGVIEKLIFNGGGSSLSALGQAALDVIRYINYPELIIEGCASLSYLFRELDLIEWSQALRMKELYKKTNITCLSQIRMHQVVRQNYKKVDLGESRIDVILPTNDRHPVKRVHYATEVNYDQTENIKLQISPTLFRRVQGGSPGASST